LFFWDKLNKSNYYLELSIENADKPLDDRLVYFLSDDLISDGGQWDMVVNVLEVPSPTAEILHPSMLTSSHSNTELSPKPSTLNPTPRPPPAF
jgi:bleomycin hydrolase